ncbi:MAG: hypothetical protein GY788_09150 [bacterium]|nr:hypothetical protein [bacterium]
MSITVRTGFKAAMAFLLMVGMLLLAPSPASAAPLTAADFAADCNTDGRLDVSGTQRYVGGSGVIVADCIVVHEAGATLVLRNVDLSAGGNIVAISSLEDATIKVVDSTIVARGALELTAGCCAGDELVPDDNGTVIVKRSTLTAVTIQLMSSFDGLNGRVVVRNSTLDATGALGVQIRASDLSGADGSLRLIDSTITSAGDILVRTGTTGRTVARRNTLNGLGTTTIATGVSGSCVSVGNTPAVACT